MYNVPKVKFNFFNAERDSSGVATRPDGCSEPVEMLNAFDYHF